MTGKYQVYKKVYSAKSLPSPTKHSTKLGAVPPWPFFHSGTSHTLKPVFLVHQLPSCPPQSLSHPSGPFLLLQLLLTSASCPALSQRLKAPALSMLPSEPQHLQPRDPGTLSLRSGLLNRKQDWLLSPTSVLWGSPETQGF